MRNLLTIQDTAVQLPLPEEFGDVVQFALDSDAGVLFVAGSPLTVAALRTADYEVGNLQIGIAPVCTDHSRLTGLCDCVRRTPGTDQHVAHAPAAT